MTSKIDNLNSKIDYSISYIDNTISKIDILIYQSIYQSLIHIELSIFEFKLSIFEVKLSIFEIKFPNRSSTYFLGDLKYLTTLQTTLWKCCALKNFKSEKLVKSINLLQNPAMKAALLPTDGWISKKKG